MGIVAKPEDYLSEFHIHFFINLEKVKLEKEKGWKKYYMELMIAFKKLFTHLIKCETEEDEEESVSEVSSVAPGFLQFVNKKTGGTGIVMSLKNQQYIAAKKHKLSRWIPFPIELSKDGILEPVEDTKTVFELLSTMNEKFSEINTKAGPIYAYTFMRQTLVPYYRHPKLDVWRKMPLSAEVRIPKMQEKINAVKAVIGFSDQLEIMATLRTCNYDVDDCICTLQSALDLHILNFQELMKKDKKGELQVSWIEVLNVLQNLKVDNNDLKNEVRRLKEEIQKTKITHDKEKDNWEQTMKAIERLEKPAIHHSDMVKKGIVDTKKLPKEPSVSATKCQRPKKGIKTHSKDAFLLLKKLPALIKLDLKNFETFLEMESKNINSIMSKSVRNFVCSSEVDFFRRKCGEEEMKRKLLFNQMQELFGNIRVFCRLRPPQDKEKQSVYTADEEVVSFNSGSMKHDYTFTRVFTTTATQEDVFLEVEPLILSCVDGYNVCLMAYGQTGSGKTHTMIGTQSNLGVNPRAIDMLMQEIQKRPTWSFEMKISVVEVYKEMVNDLLSEEEQSIKIHDSKNQVVLANLTETKVKSKKDVENVMKLSDARRKVCQTKMNSQSSRSHLLFIITLYGQNEIHRTKLESKLALCDLAGSEDISKSQVEGKALKEAIQINLSLSVLGRVFFGLCHKNSSIPFRDSKLTHILKPYLSEDAKCAIFLNVRSDTQYVQETKRTIMFGESAAKITLGKAKRHLVQT